MPTTSCDAPRLGILFLSRKRDGFDPEWGAGMVGRVRDSLATCGLQWHEPTVKIVDEGSLAAAVDDCREAGANVLVTLQTTMSDARLARSLCQLWPEPVVLWATPEKPEGAMISSCSLVGIHNWASNLFHHGRRFEIVYGAPECAATMRGLRNAAQLLLAKWRLGRTQLGVIGGQAPGFFAMAPDANALHTQLGVQVQQFSLVQFLDVLAEVGDEAVAEDVSAIGRLGLSHRDTSPSDVPMAARLYLAMRHFYDEEGVDALALRCWPELPNRTGQWPYLGMARLAEQGRGIAMEGDGDGALTAQLGNLLGFGPCFLSDWLEHTHETITLWHPGNIPFSLAPPVGEEGGPRLARHFNNQKPLVVESILQPDMPVTIVRLWNCQSRYLIAVLEGRTRVPCRGLMGSQSLVEPHGCDPHDWFVEMCHQGLPHHVAVFRGHHRGMIESWARLSGVEFRG